MEKSQSREAHPESDQTSMEGRTMVEPLPEQKDVANTEVAVKEKQEKVKSDETLDYISGWQLFAAAGIVGLACFTMLLDTSIVVTAIPVITSDFHSLSDVGWYGSAYLLACSSLQPLTGKLYSQFNNKFTFLAFILLFELGSLICGIAQSSNMLIVGRAVAGMGGSGLMNGGLTIISSSAPPEKRPALLGFLMGFAQLGILIGPLLGGALTEYTTWRWCFFINLPIGGLVVGILLLIQIPENKAARVTLTRSFSSVFEVFDIIGFLLFAPTMIMFLLALEWGGTTYSWNSAIVIGLFCGSGGMCAIFLWWEHKKGAGAMIPLGMLKMRFMYSAVTVTFFVGGTMMISSYYLAMYFQAVLGKSPTVSGVDVLPGIISNLIAAVASGIIVGKVGYYLPFAALSGVLNAIGCGLMSTFTSTTPIGIWIFYQIITGIGRGCGMQMPIVAITANLPPSSLPVGIALIIFGQQLGGSIWLAIASTAFSSSLSSGLHKYAPGVDVNVIETAGATGYRSIVSADLVQGVVRSYSKGVETVFWIAAGAAVASFCASWGLGWKSVKGMKKGGDVEKVGENVEGGKVVGEKVEGEKSEGVV